MLLQRRALQGPRAPARVNRAPAASLRQSCASHPQPHRKALVSEAPPTTAGNIFAARSQTSQQWAASSGLGLVAAPQTGRRSRVTVVAATITPLSDADDDAWGTSGSSSGSGSVSGSMEAKARQAGLGCIVRVIPDMVFKLNHISVHLPMADALLGWLLGAGSDAADLLARAPRYRVAVQAAGSSPKLNLPSTCYLSSRIQGNSIGWRLGGFAGWLRANGVTPGQDVLVALAVPLSEEQQQEQLQQQGGEPWAPMALQLRILRPEDGKLTKHLFDDACAMMEIQKRLTGSLGRDPEALDLMVEATWAVAWGPGGAVLDGSCVGGGKGRGGGITGRSGSSSSSSSGGGSGGGSGLGESTSYGGDVSSSNRGSSSSGTVPNTGGCVDVGAGGGGSSLMSSSNADDVRGSTRATERGNGGGSGGGAGGGVESGGGAARSGRRTARTKKAWQHAGAGGAERGTGSRTAPAAGATPSEPPPPPSVAPQMAERLGPSSLADGGHLPAIVKFCNTPRDQRMCRAVPGRFLKGKINVPKPLAALFNPQGVEAGKKEGGQKPAQTKIPVVTCLHPQLLPYVCLRGSPRGCLGGKVEWTFEGFKGWPAACGVAEGDLLLMWVEQEQVVKGQRKSGRGKKGQGSAVGGKGGAGAAAVQGGGLRVGVHVIRRSEVGDSAFHELLRLIAT